MVIWTEARSLMRAVLTASVLIAAGCVTSDEARPASDVSQMSARADAFERDRAAILAMAGTFRVTFDFRETVSFIEGYDLKEPYRTGGDELVFVIEDRGDFISLQHILVVGDDERFPVKHWRQDWRYEPESVLAFIGGNAWEMRDVARSGRTGRWSQTVYQVDDSPRYGALGAWSHEDGVSQWVSARAWRPLPRRDMTTRDDYHAVAAVNTHAVTPEGWVHEQNNLKLVLGDQPRALARELGINTYTANPDFDASVATTYWNDTKDYWAGVRELWSRLETSSGRFGLTVKGEPSALYMALFEHAETLRASDMTLRDALAAAEKTIDDYTTRDLASLDGRLR